MKQIFQCILASGLFFLYACSASKNERKSKIDIVRHDSEKRVDVLVDGKIFTALTWPDSVFKPVLYPVINASGIEVTRGYPIHPRPMERVDHTHHAGIWLNYGNVNGTDFWGNSHDIPEETRKKIGGEIKLKNLEVQSSEEGEGSITSHCSWLDPQGKEVLTEKTEYVFIDNGSVRIIDRVTTLTAGTDTVKMPDTKEGMFAIRVARQLELPSQEEVILTDANNIPTTVAKMTNEGVTGNYRSSEGLIGENVWSTRGKWMNLFGNINGEKISLIICDHPKNFGYPTYWHARGYGLFAANPLGAKDFTDGKEILNFSLKPGESTTFRYRVIVSSNEFLTDEKINALTDDFARKY